MSDICDVPIRFYLCEFEVVKFCAKRHVKNYIYAELLLQICLFNSYMQTFKAPLLWQTFNSKLRQKFWLKDLVYSGRFFLYLWQLVHLLLCMLQKEWHSQVIIFMLQMMCSFSIKGPKLTCCAFENLQNIFGIGNLPFIYLAVPICKL